MSLIRPVTLADEAVLRDFFAALSVESRYLRFFAPVTPSRALLDLMVGKPAHVDAIIALADGAIVGHAMAADRPAAANPGDARGTDVGVVVADAWQRHGVGAALMRALISRAQARGVTSVIMDVLPGNRRVLSMITSHWPQAVIKAAPDSLDIRLPLSPYQPPDRPRAPRPYASRPAAAVSRGAAGKALAAAGR